MAKHDLIQLWEEHIAQEFQAHDTEATLNTMVEDSCVNPRFAMPRVER